MAGMVDSTGSWSFTPDPGAMITVPDQDWMAYGAWLTTPDDTRLAAVKHTESACSLTAWSTWEPARY